MPKRPPGTPPRRTRASATRPSSTGRRPRLPASAAVPAQATLPDVLLRSSTGEVAIERTSRLDLVSRRWRYVMNNRQRVPEAVRGELRQESERQLDSLGVVEQDLRKLVESEVIEVAIRFETEADNWAARIVPWEQLLSLATWQLRDRPLTVVRRLVIGNRPAAAPPPPQRTLLVSSAPGPLKASYAEEFESECRFVRHLLTPPLQDPDLQLLTDPSAEELQKVVVNQMPHLVHLACVDTYAGWPLVNPEGSAEGFDGIFLRADGPGAAPMNAEQMADLLTAAAPADRPFLVAYSTCYSASRLAAMAVAKGVRMAIGFSGPVDGTMAEHFFGTFYRAWTENGWNTLDAFRQARLQISSHTLTQQGSAVVLWSDSSLLQVVTAAAPTQMPESPAHLEVDVKPLAELNYSLLHNRRSLFDTFKIKNLGKAEACGIKVAVQLHVAESSFPWQRTFDLKKGDLLANLRDEVQVPLVADILRQTRESIRTSLFVEVCWNGAELCRQTFGVTLLSADEWRDKEEEWRWLPCFVLPRDAAIQRVLDHAQRYLRALADDSSAGFDGYQRLAQSASGEVDYSVVDLQVRAIWAALVHDLPLGYINPPPTYTAASQRIRSPSQVLAERRGTCIDLALLLAACCEYVGLFPVIFLIQGHAFTGYWRGSDARDAWVRFRRADSSAPVTLPTNAPTATGSRQPEPWMVGKGDPFAEILGFVQDATLIPVESTVLTRLGSFAEACEAGLRNLSDPWSFDAMIDVRRAREEGVTPLPLQPTSDVAT